MSKFDENHPPITDEEKNEASRAPTLHPVHPQLNTQPVFTRPSIKFTDIFCLEFLVCVVATICPPLFIYALTFHFTQSHLWSSGITCTLHWGFALSIYIMMMSQNPWFPAILQCELAALCWIMYESLMPEPAFIPPVMAVFYLLLFGIKIEQRLIKNAGRKKEKIYWIGCFLVDAQEKRQMRLNNSQESSGIDPQQSGLREEGNKNTNTLCPEKPAT